MLNKILFTDPPHPFIIQQNQNDYVMPKELSAFKDINFTIASTPEEMTNCFQNLVICLNRESRHLYILKLVQFIFSSLQPNMLHFYLNSNLSKTTLNFLNKLISESRNEFLNQIDEILYIFFSHLLKEIMKLLNDPAIIDLQEFICKNALRKSSDLLRAMCAAKKFAEWVEADNKTGTSLYIILSAIYPAAIKEFPPLLASEIARCLIISALSLDSLQYFDIKKTKDLLVKCICRVLRYRPEAFSSPSTVFCLREVLTKEIIAPPLCEVKNHSDLVEIPNILQLVRFWQFIVGTRNPEKLVQMASCCPALQSDIFNYHHKIFEKIPESRDFFSKTLVIDSQICQFFNYPQVPDNIHDLAIFLRNRYNERVKLPAYTQILGKIISNIYHQIKSLPLCSCDASLMISAAKVMSSFISYSNKYYKQGPDDFDPVSLHYFEVSCAIAESIVYSPLYPHYPTDNPISFLLKAAFDELAGNCATRPKEFLSYLLNVKPNPAKCLLFATGLAVIGDQHKSFWRPYTLNNLSAILKMGLSLLKIPSNITINIVSFFYLTLVNFLIEIKCPLKLLYVVLLAPLLLFNSVADISMQAEPIRMQNDDEEGDDNEKVIACSEPSVILCFLGFIEKIIENKYVKSFIIANASSSFWVQLLIHISPPVTAISAQLSARAFRIIARLSDYSNSINPQFSAGQRILIDTIHYNELLEVLKLLNGLVKSDFNSNTEKGILALAIAELLLAWCSPRPISEAVKANLDLDKLLEKLKSFADESIQQIKLLVYEILNQVENSMSKVEQTEALNDLIDIEGDIPLFSSPKKICELFFGVLQRSYSNH